MAGNDQKSARTLEDILKSFKKGAIDLDTAKKEIDLFSLEYISDIATLDPCRQMRKGVPEVVYADIKTPENAAAIAVRLVERNGYAFLTRVQGEQGEQIIHEIREKTDGDFEINFNQKARTVILKRTDFSIPQSGGTVGIITAGTSDISVAEEAKETCSFLGIRVITAYDVGISGIHRIFEPIREMIEADVSAIIVVAGMEGALPSVVSSLVDVPVIGVPSSVGYGFGGKGKAALMSMLQSCSPGLVVVNIDNGFGAGVAAALITRQRNPGKQR